MRHAPSLVPAASVALLALALAAAGCSEPSSLPTDAGVDAPSGETDAGPGETDAGPPDGGCDVSPIPGSLPAIAGGFAVEDPDAGSSVPVATGGDPTGTWVFDDATFWVPPAAAAMFDPARSTVTGTAWAALDGSELRLDFRFETTLMGTIAGTIVRPSSTQIRGTYVVDGAMVDVTPICAQGGSASGGGSADLSFSIEGDDATLISRLSGPSGMITIVLTGTRRTTP